MYVCMYIVFFLFLDCSRTGEEAEPGGDREAVGGGSAVWHHHYTGTVPCGGHTGCVARDVAGYIHGLIWY